MSNKVFTFAIEAKEFLTTQAGREYLLMVFQSNGEHFIINTYNQLMECISTNPNSILMFGENGIPKHIFRELKKNQDDVEVFLKENNCIIASFKKEKWFIERVYYRFVPKKEKNKKNNLVL